MYEAWHAHRSLQVLVCDLDYLMVGVPGSGLSDTALMLAGLPSVPDMLAGSLDAECLFPSVGEAAGLPIVEVRQCPSHFHEHAHTYRVAVLLFKRL